MRTKTNKQQLWEKLLGLLGQDGFERRTPISEGIVTGERFTLVNDDRILIEAIGFFQGQHKTITMNSVTIKRIEGLIEMIEEGKHEKR